MKITVQEVIDTIIEPVGRLEDTVDTLVCGSPETEVTGIATAFMPTRRVIEQAAERGANLVIAHEGLFFAHRDETVPGREGEVLEEKRRFLNEAGVAVFRCHDYWHRVKPDGITAGLIEELGWTPYVRVQQPAASVLDIPTATLAEIAERVKERLGLSSVRAIGAAEEVFSRLGVLVGYRGGASLAVPLFEQEGAELVLYGEGQEWETPEYVREAIDQGKKKALLVIGHAESEEPGMKALAKRLGERFPSLPVFHLRERPLFRTI